MTTILQPIITILLSIWITADEINLLKTNGHYMNTCFNI
jgi:hypothetical protein